ncbi:unnamed protein product [Chrysodeixis includens]|uniref:Uncharacterized protein n=1 Tax=Chrysodeixis includens TaxID=689277 RepID=A0A9P0BWQ8_CHRIL|nr:unnamed protein product [Chrysodeixis includens]
MLRRPQVKWDKGRKMIMSNILHVHFHTTPSSLKLSIAYIVSTTQLINMLRYILRCPVALAFQCILFYIYIGINSTPETRFFLKAYPRTQVLHKMPLLFNLFYKYQMFDLCLVILLKSCFFILLIKRLSGLSLQRFTILRSRVSKMKGV